MDIGQNIEFWLGQIEDVNDPTMSGRVKVRIVGIHPVKKTGENGLSTEDLPWAQVLLPTTVAQVARTGTKHGLLPGSNVIGFFMDSHQQKPIVMATMGLTAGATKTNNRVTSSGSASTLSESDPAFKPTIPNDGTFPNVARLTPDEIGGQLGNAADPSGNIVLSMAEGPCGKQVISQADKSRQEKYNSNSNPSGQIVDVAVADGACSSVKWGTETIQRLLKEQMPNALSRFKYNDQVWDAISGKYLNIRGITASLACTIATELIPAIMGKKVNLEDLNRKLRKTILQGVGLDRDGTLTEKADDAQQVKDDTFHSKLTQLLLDMLCSLINKMLTDMDNQAGSHGMINPGAFCVAQQLTNNVESITDDIIIQALDIAANIEDAIEDGDTSSLFDSLGELGTLLFNEKEFYTTRAPHNKAGDGSQDKANRTKRCNPFRLLSTVLGAYKSFSGISASSLLSQIGLNLPTIPQFGGANRGTSGYNIVPCNGANDLSSGFYRFPIGYFGNSNSGSEFNDLGSSGFGSFDGSGLYGNNSAISSAYYQYGQGDSGYGYGYGYGAKVEQYPLPSFSTGPCATNFVIGTPNVSVIKKSGRNYLYFDEIANQYRFPVVYIQGYDGTPVPVINRKNGSLVAIVTSCASYQQGNPTATTTIIPATDENNSDKGIMSDDPNYDIRLGGIFIENTGFNYCQPIIKIIDSDTGKENGEARVTILNGRVVNVEVINPGTGFRSIPKIVVEDDGANCDGVKGYGVKLYAIMTVVPITNGGLNSGIDGLNIKGVPWDVIFRISPTSTNGVYNNKGELISDIAGIEDINNGG